MSNNNYEDLDKKILELYNLGLSNVSISEKLKCSTNTVWRHLKRHNILRFNSKELNINWSDIQTIYNTGLSETDLRSHGYVTRTQLDIAKKNGNFIARSKEETNNLIGKKRKGSTLSQEAKDNLSKIMSERHKKGMAYTLGHNERLKDRSYPEKWFESVIKDRLHNKNFNSQYRIGRYCLDFAWISEKKCVEVDGETHYRFQNEIEKDIKRDNWLKEQGWSIIRFRWKEVISNKEKYINDLIKFIDGV